MDYKPGMFGSIKELLQKANRISREGRLQNQDVALPEVPLKAVESKEESDSRKKVEKPVMASAATKQKRKKSKTEKIHQKDVSVKESSPANSPSQPCGIEGLLDAAKASKAKKNLKEAQVWIDEGLYRQIEMFNLKCGKPVPLKHVVNAILRLYLEEHKTEMAKAKRP